MVMTISGLSSDNLTAPNSTNSDPTSVWLYNNMQKSPTQYSYQPNDLNPILNDNISRDGNYQIYLDQ